MTHTGNSRVERQGVGLAMTAFERLGMAFRSQDVQDFGIDAHAELLDCDSATGRLLGIQLKSGDSYFRESTEDGFVFRFDAKHYDYWLNHSLPVIVVLCDVNRKQLLWQRIASDTAESTGEGWKIIVPRVQLVDEHSASLLRDAATRVPPPTTYSVLGEQDVSHGAAKRYSVNVLLNEALTKPEIAAVVRQVTLTQIGSRYYRDYRVESRWGDVDAHVVWTYVYASYDDFKHKNHLCRSWWIDPSLPVQARPSESGGENVGMSVMVAWSLYHSQLAKVLADHEMTKSEYLKRVDRLVPQLETAMERVAHVVFSASPHRFDEERVDREVSAIEQTITTLHNELVALGLAPLECRDLDNRVQTLAATAHNAVLPYTETGKSTWDRRNALFLARSAAESFAQEMARFRFEREKV